MCNLSSVMRWISFWLDQKIYDGECIIFSSMIKVSNQLFHPIVYNEHSFVWRKRNISSLHEEQKTWMFCFVEDGAEEEKMPLSERALLEVQEDESTTTTNLKTPSVSTLVLMDEPVEPLNSILPPASLSPSTGSAIYFAKPQRKLDGYWRRHRTLLVSVALCLLAWIVFAVVTLYTVAELQWQCRANGGAQRTASGPQLGTGKGLICLKSQQLFISYATFYRGFTSCFHS